MAHAPAAWESYADWYQRGAYAPFVAEARLSRNAPVQLLRVRQPAGDFPDPPTPDLSLALVLKGIANVHVDLGAGRFSGSGQVGTFTVAPSDVACDYRIDGPVEFLVLVLPGAATRAVLAAMGGPCAADHGALHATAHQDSAIESMVRRLWVEAAEGNLMGPLYADDAATAISARLARLALRANGRPMTKNEDTAPLHGVRLARVMAHIEDSLDSNLSQAELAGTAGLSAWHFCRAFKASTGCAPHRFVLLRRLARAQWLLRTTRLSLIEVAAACGFSSHAHLTMVFRREVGVTPSAWRRSAGRQ